MRLVIPLFKSCGDLAQVLWRNWNFDQLQHQAFALFALAESRQHARVVLSSSENFVTGFEIHAHQQNLERLRRVARDRNLFAVATKHFGEAGADRFRLRLEYLPHRVGRRVFLLPDVTDQSFGNDSRAGDTPPLFRLMMPRVTEKEF